MVCAAPSCARSSSPPARSRSRTSCSCTRTIRTPRPASRLRWTSPHDDRVRGRVREIRSLHRRASWGARAASWPRCAGRTSLGWSRGWRLKPPSTSRAPKPGRPRSRAGRPAVRRARRHGRGPRAQAGSRLASLRVRRRPIPRARSTAVCRARARSQRHRGAAPASPRSLEGRASLTPSTAHSPRRQRRSRRSAWNHRARRQHRSGSGRYRAAEIAAWVADLDDGFDSGCRTPSAGG